jgi:hypothetical protein
VKTGLLFVGLLLSVTVSAQQNTEPHANGTIYGVAIDNNGQPAKRIGLVATPLGVPLATKLPDARTNDSGEYRFEHLPWWADTPCTPRTKKPDIPVSAQVVMVKPNLLKLR